MKKKELVELLSSEKQQNKEIGPAKMRPMSPLLKKIQKLI
jgi:hypothetical protein